MRRLEVLPTHEIALRLFYLYDHYRRNPVASAFPDAEAQGMLVSHSNCKSKCRPLDDSRAKLEAHSKQDDIVVS